MEPRGSIHEPSTLGRLGRAAVPRLIELLQNPNPEVRGLTVGTLGSIGDAAAVLPLRAALQDKDEWVRIRVAEALKRVEDAA